MTATHAEALAVLRSVTYAALFDYPLTLAQLRESLIGVAADDAQIAAWLASSPLLRATVHLRNGLVFPRGRHDLPATRTRREAASRALLVRDDGALRFVTHLPFVRMVAISGSLAHLNADDGADLDLFVITTPGRVWSVTVVTLVVARLAGWRQRLCLNYVVSERALAVTPPDLFSANQIIHLRPLMGADVYRRFLDANGFVAAIYPNFRGREPTTMAADPWWRGRRLMEAALLPVAPMVEALARRLYGWHLRRRAATWRSLDQVRLDPECLKLHTSSHRQTTLARFEAAMDDALMRAAQVSADFPRTGTV
jgi:hypothetical protein